MIEAATPTGAGKPARTSRQQAMEEIERGRLEELNADLPKEDKIEFTPTDAAVDDDDDADAVAERVAEAERKRLERTAKKEEAEQAADGEKKNGGDVYDFLGEDRFATTKAKIKVDGVEQEVVIGDVLRDVQKSRAADRRLEEAAILRKQAEADTASGVKAAAEREAKDIKSAAEAEAAEIKRRAAEEAAANRNGAPPVSDGLKEAVALIYEGDHEKSAASLSKVIDEEVDRRVKLIPGATVDTNAIAAQVRSQVSWDVALEQFAADHKDIVSDPYMLGVMQDHLNKAATPGVSPADAVRIATGEFGAWRERVSGKPLGQKVVADDDALEKREAAKAAAAGRAVRSSTSVAASGGKADERPPTPSETIAEMKKARGQSS